MRDRAIGLVGSTNIQFKAAPIEIAVNARRIIGEVALRSSSLTGDKGVVFIGLQITEIKNRVE